MRSVPVSMREAAMALGATKWQAIWHQVLPAGMPAVLTGVILALGRAIGETAPLIAIGAFTSVFFVPTSPMDSFTVLPIQVFSWLSRPLRGFQENAAAGIVILLVCCCCSTASRSRCATCIPRGANDGHAQSEKADLEKAGHASAAARPRPRPAMTT